MTDHDVENQAWHGFKVGRVEQWIGKQHELVLHAIIPYSIGGGLDQYYFDFNGHGTAVVTMELSENSGNGPGNSTFVRYELAMFTRFPFDAESAQDESTANGSQHLRITAFLNTLAPYCSQATIERFDTCEFPPDLDDIGGSCVVFDALGHETTPTHFGIMVAIEIFREEMEFARIEGGEKLLGLLKQSGLFPFSTRDRPPVV